MLVRHPALLYKLGENWARTRVHQTTSRFQTGGFQTGGFPDLDLSFLFCPFWDFPDFSGIFPICLGMVRGFSRLVLFLSLSLLKAPTRNSPERVRDTIWTVPEKSGKPPGLETPRFSFSQGSFSVVALFTRKSGKKKPIQLTQNVKRSETI